MEANVIRGTSKTKNGVKCMISVRVRRTQLRYAHDYRYALHQDDYHNSDILTQPGRDGPDQNWQKSMTFLS